MAQPTGWPRNVLVWIASPVRGRPGGIHQVRAPDAGRERKAAGERFAQADQVGNGPRVFAGKPVARCGQSRYKFRPESASAWCSSHSCAQLRQEIRRRNVDAAARLDRLDQHGADGFPAEKLAQSCLPFWQPTDGSPGRRGWETGTKWPNRPNCDSKWPAKMVAVRGVERAVAESVVRAFKGDDSAFARGQQGRLERGFHRLEAGIGKNGLAGVPSSRAPDLAGTSAGAAGPALKRDAGSIRRRQLAP